MSWNTRIGPVAGVIFVATAATAVAEPQPHASDILYHMAEATRAMHYTGTFVYHRGNQIHSLKIVHRGESNDAEGNGEYERMTSLTGAAREVIRDGSRVVCIYADNRSVVVEKSPSTKYFPLALIGASNGIGAYYQVEVKGDDRVAGRATWNVAVRPTADDRYGYAIWIDKESKLPFGAKVVDAKDRILEEIQFTSLTTHDAIPDGWLEPEFGSAGYRWFANTKPGAEVGADDIAGVSVESGWNVSWLPAGFKKLEDHEQMVSASRVPVRHWVFSDGLAVVSVFIEQLDDVKTPLRGFSTRGAVNALGRVERNHQITVVGEVPLDTVRHIAGAIEFRGTR